MTPPTPHTNTTLVLRRTFPASRQRVFRAWIEPEALEQWLKPAGKNIAVSKLDARAGGSFRFDLENGGCITGTYLQIIPPEQLVFTWTGTAIQEQETIVTLDFLDLGQTVTEVVLTHEGLNTPDLYTMFGSGWPSLFDMLASVLPTISTSDTSSG